MKCELANRELSWLSFNERVMQEAKDKTVPLLSRLQFLGIFSNNQDEFFKVRVASLMRLVAKAGDTVLTGGYTPHELLSAVNERMERDREDFVSTYTSILGEMHRENICVVNEKSLTDTQKAFCREYFSTVVSQRLVPLIVRKSVKIPFLPDGNAYLGVRMSKEGDSRVKYAVIRIPTSSSCPRFVVLPSEDGRKDVIFLDDIIRLMIDDIFFMFSYDNISVHSFKIVRDAELEMDDDVSKSLFERVAEGVESRRRGLPVRLIYDRDMPEDLLSTLAGKLRLSGPEMLSPGDRYHLMKDLMKFPKVRPDLLTVNPPALQHRDIIPFQSILKVIRSKDLLLNYPYHSFQHFIDFLREAAIDPRVESIFITLYRTAEHSKVLNTLVNAAKNGKKVSVMIELKARFDEEQNIENTDMLQKEGVKIIYSLEDLKVHSKIVLVERREASELRGYAYIGTGNFNEDTARIYGDFGLFTADKGIVEDVRNVFMFLMNTHRQYVYKHLLVSPYYMRNSFGEMIDAETRNARKGLQAYIYAKCNSLTDEKIIRKLYRASEAGVKIRLIVRGACCLKPGVAGMSENIQAISIVDKYLEHARLFIFCNGGDERVYIGSADWMRRNLDRRVEVCAPILDKKICKLLGKVFAIQWSDNVKARDLADQEGNSYVHRLPSDPIVRSQVALYEYYKGISEMRSTVE